MKGDSRDANFLEVILGKCEEDSQVDVLLLQQGEVLTEPNLLQKLCQIL